MKIKTIIFAGWIAGTLALQADTLDEKTHELVSKMILAEKLDMIHGNVFSIVPVPRLGILPINMSDASMGLRVTPDPPSKGLEPSTAFPSTQLLAATWNPEMAHRYATAVAEEFRARNMHILLGPGINIYRSPLCGRNFEYMGEDPYLASRMVVPYVKAVREVGVIPVVKHFVANNSEPHRKQSSSEVSERALRELYFPAFKAAVEEGETLGIMSSYNLLNGTYCGENSWLLKKVLRDEWGFRGVVFSDWCSIWNSELAVNSGVDIEMPGGQETFILSPENVQRLLKEGKTTPQEIDTKVFHLVRSFLEMNMYSPNWARPELNKLNEHAQVALETAREGTVLLKNQNHLLPLEPSAVRKIVVIGPTAKKTPTAGGGSGAVRPENPISIWDGIQALYGAKAELLEAFDADKIKNADAVIVCVGYNTGQVLDDPRVTKEESITTEQPANKLDTSEQETADRSSYSLPDGDDELIARCASANPKTVVLYVAGGGIAMPWIDSVASILWMGYPGQNGSQAAAEILAGQVNPSGKLPISIEKQLKDSAAYGRLGLSWDDHNGTAYKAGIRDYWKVDYSEGIFLGYRHLDQKKIEPQFPFGHGLSFTTFKFGDLKSQRTANGSIQISVTVKNTGTRKGKEIVQLYVSDEKSSLPRPPKELKGFQKIELASDETQVVKFTLGKDAFSFWSPKKQAWVFEPGKFTLLIGSSSRDIRIQKTITLD